jgi:hypothetical protein
MFAFRLCLELGYVHPDEMLRRMTARQFAEWCAFYGLDPFGEQRADLRAGIVAATMNNRWRNKNENPSKPADFMPYHRQAEQTPEEIQRTLRGILGQVIPHG